MTYVTNSVFQHDVSNGAEPFMAIVDEYGQEIPFNEYDIQRSLEQLSEINSDHPKSLDLLMDRVIAARAIA
ncbi:MAG: hypothetical protein OEY11_06540 [Gammaproteobacteria bacterium]|nr:hypothetical protein [Gammaproteobacteria bacterium]